MNTRNGFKEQLKNVAGRGSSQFAGGLLQVALVFGAVLGGAFLISRIGNFQRPR